MPPKMFMPDGVGGYAKPLKKDGRKVVRGHKPNHQKNGKPYQVTIAMTSR
jgi:hypothetical protein